MQTFSEIISLWASHDELAQDLSKAGVTIKRVLIASWKHRDNIPAGYWPPLVEAATKRGFQDVNYELLANIAHAKRTKDKVA